MGTAIAQFHKATAPRQLLLHCSTTVHPGHMLAPLTDTSDRYIHVGNVEIDCFGRKIFVHDLIRGSLS